MNVDKLLQEIVDSCARCAEMHKNPGSKYIFTMLEVLEIVLKRSTNNDLKSIRAEIKEIVFGPLKVPFGTDEKVNKQLMNQPISIPSTVLNFCETQPQAIEIGLIPAVCMNIKQLKLFPTLHPPEGFKDWMWAVYYKEPHPGGWFKSLRKIEAKRSNVNPCLQI